MALGRFYITKTFLIPGGTTDYNVRANHQDLFITEASAYEMIMKQDKDIMQKVNDVNDGAWPLQAGQDWKDAGGNVKNIFITTTVDTNIWIRFKYRD